MSTQKKKPNPTLKTLTKDAKAFQKKLADVKTPPVNADVQQVLDCVTESVGNLQLSKVIGCYERKLPANDSVVVIVLTDKEAKAYVFAKKTKK